MSGCASVNVNSSSADSENVPTKRGLYEGQDNNFQQQVLKSNDLLEEKDGVSKQTKSLTGDLDSQPIEKVVLAAKPTRGVLSSPYGIRKIGKRKVRPHYGIDLSAQRGTPVIATASGKVIFAGRRSSFGKLVEIDHGSGIITRYAHLDKISVKAGNTVNAREQLGTLGKTGRVTGANLHFEVLVNNKQVDPLTLVTWTNDNKYAGLSVSYKYKVR